jgi:hypothetical protein
MNERRRAVFLSASFPQPGRAEHFPPSDPAALADAVTAVAREILRRRGVLVSGGHPTITPLLLYVCAEYGYANSLVVYQSERFRDEIPQETWRLSEEGWGELLFTESSGERARDLDVMRTEMLTAQVVNGAVFIGGMEGIAIEYRLVGELAPNTPRFPVSAPGGAAATLETAQGRGPTLDLSSPRYPVLAREIADALDL